MSVTVVVGATGMYFFVLSEVSIFSSLRHRIAARARQVAEYRARRENVEATAIELRRLETSIRKGFAADASTPSVEEVVARVIDRLGRADMRAVSVSRESADTPECADVLRTSFRGSFESVGIFLLALRDAELVGLSLSESHFSKEEGDELSVRLSWSLRPITRKASDCLVTYYR